ncbi:hypothetical protein H0G77_07060 [[Pasteurella] aerogenes]|nr:hypothetical protein [[Pasteurella] aerogenes]
MTKKLLKHELVERLLQLKEKQDLLTVQMQLLTQEISELAAPFMPKTPKSQTGLFSGKYPISLSLFVPSIIPISPKR